MELVPFDQVMTRSRSSAPRLVGPLGPWRPPARRYTGSRQPAARALITGPGRARAWRTA
jgi:hypothetical protein